MSNKQIEVYAEALRRQREEAAKKTQPAEPVVTKSNTQQSTRKTTPKATRSRKVSSDNPREKAREFPTRDEIQEFSFRLRDSLKVKVQAEVPHQWQDELEEIARRLKVKKLELYRFILGEFLGKVKRKPLN